MSPAPVIKQIHTYELANFLSLLGGTLIKGGCQPNHLPQLFGQYAKLTCVDCGISLMGPELAALALPEPAGEPPNPKVGRVRQGYCARQGCSSHYYTLTLAPHPGLDWAELFRALENPAPTGQEAEPPGSPAVENRGIRRQPLARLAVGLVLIAILLACRYFMSGGTIPGLSHKHKYAIDPQSLTRD